MCISVPGEPAMWESVISVVSPQTGSDEPVGIDGCESGTSELVGCVSACWSERVDGDDYELIGSIDGTTVSDVCLSEPGEPAMWQFVDGIVSPRTGSDEPIGIYDCNSRTSGPVSCVSTSGTGSTGCDAYESIGSVLCTYNSGVCISEPGEPDMGRCVSSVVLARTGSDVSVDDIGLGFGNWWPGWLCQSRMDWGCGMWQLWGACCPHPDRVR